MIHASTERERAMLGMWGPSYKYMRGWEAVVEGTRRWAGHGCPLYRNAISSMNEVRREIGDSPSRNVLTDDSPENDQVRNDHAGRSPLYL